MRDIYKSARGKFRECKYYLRDENNRVGDLSVWVLKNTPQGEFLAVETQSISNQANQINNAFIYDTNNVTLMTNDKVDDLERGCVVLYLNYAWMVEAVQREIKQEMSEFANELTYTTYISIRR